METTISKNSRVLIKSWCARMRWFLCCVKSSVSHKNAMETLFVSGHVINNRKLWLTEKTKTTTGSVRRTMAQHVLLGLKT